MALCALAPVTGAFDVIDKQFLPGGTGSCRGVPMAASADKGRIYVAWRGEAFRLFSFALDRDARRLTCLGGASLPASMCYTTVSSCGQVVLSTSNTGSVIAVSVIDEEGRAGDPLLTQEAFKAHCLVMAANGLAYVTSLRGDFVQSYAFDAARRDLKPLTRLELPEASGPRHIVFTADGTRAYLLSEFAGTLTSLNVDAETGSLSVLDRVEMLPGVKRAWAAELRLGPDQTVLYASERSTSQIFAYRTGTHGGMELIGAVPAPECPTAFDLCVTGRHLVALGEKSGEAWVYRIDGDGLPDRVTRTEIGAVPSWTLAL
ncbi:hypothetical protein, not 6-phosphogluconolactonase [Salipiger mucosus DSM 16094]|uniref:6-phosphogluconolactonase n=1 Tax=Salipiger mucosus DSM 16094 TaxID=1123237 RepID=S9QVQ2_9RHOB|nr:hypothetical protein, not 6-phosphogluconolactonase [Salipiger mucosus DSM 16094]